MRDIEGIIIRSATSAELPLMEQLARKIWPFAYGKILDRKQIEYMIKLMYALPVVQEEVASGIVYELILDGENPIGFISYGPYKADPPTIKLHKLYLDPSYHGRGIGSMALQHALASARLAKARFLRLNVNKYNAPAIRAYQRNGFVQVESVKVDIGNGYFMDDFVMQAEL